MARKPLLSPTEIDFILNRLCWQLIERHGRFEQTVIIGLQPRGTAFAARLLEVLATEHGLKDIPYGQLDITFFRDDFRRREEPLRANSTQIDFLVEGKHVVFVDDVLYTGRSIRAAMDAILSFGRPASIELMVLIDRRFKRQLPIQPDYTGKRVDSLAHQRVAVEWGNNHSESTIYLISAEEHE
jgi:pyrimidine operon attenuation protein/uracil phosphoribosyltransferase